MITTDGEGGVNFINPVAESLTGWSRDEAVGRPLGEIFRIVNEDTGEAAANPVERVLQEGVTVGLANHTALVKKDGSVVPIDDSGAPIRDQQDVIGAVLVFRDFTERRQAMREMQESRQRLDLAMQAGRMGAWAIELRTGRVTWSASLEKIHGIEPGTFGGRLEDVQNFVHAEDRERFADSIARVIENPGEYQIEVRIVRRDGTIAWLENRGGLLLDERGQPERMAGIAMDVTQRVLADTELRRTKDRVSSILDSITDGFLAVDREWRFTYVNDVVCRGAGKSREEIMGQVIWDIFPESLGTDFYTQCQRVMHERVAAQFEVHYPERGIWVEAHVQPTEEGLSAYAMLIGERKSAEIELHRRLAQQNAVARLGAAALASRDLAELLHAGAEVVAKELGIEYVSILESTGGRQELVLQSGYGWPADVYGTTLPADSNTQVSYTLQSGGPVVMESSDEASFRLPETLARAGVSSGISVVIPGAYAPWGVLAAFATRRRAFAANDTQFVQAVANILANAIRRQREEEERERLAAMLQSSEDAIVGKDLNGVVLTWNRGAETIYGYTAAEMIGQPITRLLPAGAEAEEAAILARIRRGERVDSFEGVRVRKDGTQIHVSLTISPVHDRSGRVVGASHIARDISERKHVEEKLQQTQKLESLGILAGGIAHDFNNLLTGILGNATLMTDYLPTGEPARELADNVILAAERAAHLTRQMLAYSGRGHFLIQLTDCSQQVREITALIGASIPKNVDLRLVLADDLPMIEADTGQFQQLLMNLVINGAEAVGSAPGVVTVVTRVEGVGADEIARMTFAGEIRPGRYVSLEVRDSGSGMDEATLSRIFDPFFTTKFTGRGLGLAAVLGIVRGHQGAIDVRSAPGQGTTFRVLFPPSARQRVEAEPAAGEASHQACTVLVVDDEDVVRRAATAALEKYGYRVMVAEDGLGAVEIFRAMADEIAAVVLDMTMPVMSGDQTFQELRKIRPDVTVVASSGYSEAEAVERFGQGIAGFVQKPYTANGLAAKVSEAISGRMTAGAG